MILPDHMKQPARASRLVHGRLYSTGSMMESGHGKSILPRGSQAVTSCLAECHSMSPVQTWSYLLKCELTPLLNPIAEQRKTQFQKKPAIKQSCNYRAKYQTVYIYREQHNNPIAGNIHRVQIFCNKVYHHIQNIQKLLLLFQTGVFKNIFLILFIEHAGLLE